MREPPLMVALVTVTPVPPKVTRTVWSSPLVMVSVVVAAICFKIPALRSAAVNSFPFGTAKKIFG